MASGFIPCVTMVNGDKQVRIDLLWASGEVGYRFEPELGLEDLLNDPDTRVMVWVPPQKFIYLGPHAGYVGEDGGNRFTSIEDGKMAIETVKAVLKGHVNSSLLVLRDWLRGKE